MTIVIAVPYAKPGMKKIQLIVIGVIATVSVFVIVSSSENKNNFFTQRTTPTPTIPVLPDLDISVCNPSRGPFSLAITNPYLPLPVGMIHILRDSKSTVQIHVLNKTEIVAGVVTRIVEEREWEHDVLSEKSRNYFVQAPDGTVCYYGEDVNEYKDGKVVSTEGTWRAGVDQNEPGIAMPAHATVGQAYMQEMAPDIATDHAAHTGSLKSYTTPIGLFYNVLVVDEVPQSHKKFAPGVGLIYDNGLVITKR